MTRAASRGSAVGAVEPAVIGAAQPLLLGDPELHRRGGARSARRAARVALPVGVGDEVLAEQADLRTCLVAAARPGGRVPVAAEQLPGGSGADPRQPLVLFAREHRREPPRAPLCNTASAVRRSARSDADPRGAVPYRGRRGGAMAELAGVIYTSHAWVDRPWPEWKVERAVRHLRATCPSRATRRWRRSPSGC